MCISLLPMTLMAWMEKKDAKFRLRDETQLSLYPIFFLLTDSPRGLRPEQGCQSWDHSRSFWVWVISVCVSGVLIGPCSFSEAVSAGSPVLTCVNSCNFSLLSPHLWPFQEMTGCKSSSETFRWGSLTPVSFFFMCRYRGPLFSPGR